MSETSVTTSPTRSAVSARPVSLITIVFVFALLAAALFLGRYLYRPTSALPHDAAAENLSKDLEWRATAKSRREAFSQLSDAQAKKLNSYGWVDQKAGAVQLPIERAMELTVQKYGSHK